VSEGPPTAVTYMQEKEERLRRWHAENPGRSAQLNDAIDACPTLAAKRVLFASFSKPDQDGMLEEYARRSLNRQMTPGTLVRHRYERGALINVVTREGKPAVGRYVGLACVVGQDDGEYGRYLWLYTPWNDGSGEAHVFAKANCYDMEEVAEAAE